MFTLEIHYHGSFLLNPEPKYIGGKVEYVEDVDPDFISIFELRDFLKILKLPIYMPMHYRVSDTELRCITDDVSVLEMFGMYRDNPHIVIYVGDMASDHLNCGLWVNIDDDPVFGVEEMGKNIGLEVGKQVIGNEGSTFDDEKVGNDGPTTENEESEKSSENASDLNYFLDGDNLSDSCGPIDEGEVYKSNFVAVDLGDYIAYAELIDEEFRAFMASKSARKVVEEEIISDNEILDTLFDSSDKEDAVKFPEFNEEEDMKSPNMIVGLLFPNVQVYRKALRMYSINKGFELKFKKNDGDRVTAICQNDCGWKIYASLYRGTKTFQIKSIEGTSHKCPWSYTNRSANSTWLAEQFLNEIANDPKWKTKGFKKAVKNKFRVRVSSSQAYRARRKAMLTIQGDHKNQYLKLRDYCATIIEKNHGSVAILLTDRVDVRKNPVFKRIFVMYKAQIDGFIEGCRPVIGLDACHLKGKFGGHLMSAVGRDANNQMYPIAMACVESECKESWCWFLDILVCHIGTPTERGWIFIYDRQKGLIETFDTLFPGVEHRFCVRHLYANFKLRFKGKALRDILWAAARAYLPNVWETKMRELQKLDNEAYKWLSKIPCSFWARFTFNSRSKCDLLCNNVSECFNQYISTAREEPILSMLETIRRQIMCRFQEKREWITKVNGHLCPRIQVKLEEVKTKAFMFEPILAGQGTCYQRQLGGQS